MSNWTRGRCSGNWYSFNMPVSAWHSCSLGSLMQCTYSPCRSWARNPFVDMRSESILSIHCVLSTEYYSMRKHHRVCLVSGVKFVRGRIFHVLLKVGYGNWLCNLMTLQSSTAVYISDTFFTSLYLPLGLIVCRCNYLLSLEKNIINTCTSKSYETRSG